MMAFQRSAVIEWVSFVCINWLFIDQEHALLTRLDLVLLSIRLDR